MAEIARTKPIPRFQRLGIQPGNWLRFAKSAQPGRESKRVGRMAEIARTNPIPQFQSFRMGALKPIIQPKLNPTRSRRRFRHAAKRRRINHLIAYQKCRVICDIRHLSANFNGLAPGDARSFHQARSRLNGQGPENIPRWSPPAINPRSARLLPIGIEWQSYDTLRMGQGPHGSIERHDFAKSNHRGEGDGGAGVHRQGRDCSAAPS